MFRSEGAARSDRLNRWMAGSLAFIGGYVNAVGVVRLGLFTSHATGNVARGALDLGAGQFAQGATALSLVAAFFFGAFGAHIVLESPRRIGRRYAVALAAEAVLLVVYAVGGEPALLLSAAMGLQNSLVTRLSGAIVRTTHLTGVVTDLGIEAARWVRFVLVRGAERPAVEKSALLGTIAGTFTIGALAGSILTAHAGTVALALPIVALVAFAGSAARA